MSDNGYNVKSREILGIDQEENADNYPITSANELQTCLADGDKTYIHLQADLQTHQPDYVEWVEKEQLRAYRLGVDMERDRVVESYYEYEEENPEGTSLRDFIDWHLGA